MASVMKVREQPALKYVNGHRESKGSKLTSKFTILRSNGEHVSSESITLISAPIAAQMVVPRSCITRSDNTLTWRLRGGIFKVYVWVVEIERGEKEKCTSIWLGYKNDMREEVIPKQGLNARRDLRERQRRVYTIYSGSELEYDIGHRRWKMMSTCILGHSLLSPVDSIPVNLVHTAFVTK